VGAWRFGWLSIALLMAAIVYDVAGASDPPAIPDVYAIPSPEPDRRGTAQQPFVVSKPTNEQVREAADQRAHASNEKAITIATIVLAFFTIALWVANVRLIGATKRASAQQALDTQRAIGETKRSADAIQSMADATKSNAANMQSMFAKQMRAYVTVDVGRAIYQDATLRFEAIPIITNNGLTPATNVCFKILAEIKDGSHAAPPIQFADIGDLMTNDIGLAPRQSFTIRRVVHDRVPDSDVNEIMQGNPRRLYAWGKVTYGDVYGGSWERNFCLSYWFAKVGDEVKVFGNFHPEHNNAT
jgi:hypothetical protein